MKAAALLALLLSTPLTTGAAEVARPLRVQLLWSNQAQFAGFYVAEARKFFQAEGVEVELVPGGPGIFPIHELQSGTVDVAVSWFDRAAALSTPGKRITNVAQIFSGSGLTLLCRNSAGVVTPRYLEGKRVGVWGLGDEHVVEEIALRLGLPESAVTLVPQRPNGIDLVEGKVDCVTAMSYNEYWSVLAAGVSVADLLVITPSDFGIFHLEDGLYVSTDRLESPAFREKLVRLVRALRRGWEDVRARPTFALHTVLQVNPALDPEQQRFMLESVLKLIPDSDRFGHFDLGRFHSAVAVALSHQLVTVVPPDIWTHQIWRQIEARDGTTRPLGNATVYYLTTVTDSRWFKLIVMLGVATFALSGVLEAVRRRYDLYGVTALAFLSALGGGAIRDILIGGERYPLYFVKDPTSIILVIVISVAASAVFLLWPWLPDRKSFKLLKFTTDTIGFSILAIVGARAAVNTSAPWLWMPLAAAVTCAGGGAMRDVVVNQEPKTFKGVIYEEVAVIGALVFLCGLWISERFESTPVPVYLSMGVAMILTAALRVLVYRKDLSYGSFFPRKASRPASPEA